jgi:hypothetical protein
MVHVPELLLSRLLEVREVLMFSFDLEVLEQPLEAEAYATPSPWLPAFTVPGARAAVVGRDAMGGLYVACEFSSSRSPCFLHLDTCGQVVLLGESLQEAVAILVALPYWRELIAQCPSGSFDAMRAQAVQLEREVLEDLPALPASRGYLFEFLALPALPNPLARLCELNDAKNAVTVMSPHGWRYESPARHPTKPEGERASDAP